MKDPFGKEIGLGDIILYARYDLNGHMFVVAEVLELTDELINGYETRGILKGKVIKSSLENYPTSCTFSAYNSNVLLLKSIKGAV